MFFYLFIYLLIYLFIYLFIYVGRKLSPVSETDRPVQGSSDPPEVNVSVPEFENLPDVSEPWDDGRLPIDFLLLTVKDCEFLSCIAFLNAGFYKSYHEDLGFVYFGEMGKGKATNAKIALMKCHMGSSGPGGSTISVKDAVTVLKPKAVFCVGFCGGLNRKKVKLGDVAVSAKLITYALSKSTEDGIEERGFRVPLKRRLSKLILSAGEGWQAPLRKRGELKVAIQRDGVFLSGPEVVNNNERRLELMRRFPEAIAIEMEGEGKNLSTDMIQS